MPIEQAVPTRQFRQWRPLRMDKYILGEVIGPFFGGLIFFLFIFLMSQVLRLAEFFIVHGVSGWTLLKMTFFLGLSFLPTALPVAFLISVLMAFGRLSADSELVAMKASGFGAARLSAPLVIFSLLIVGLCVGLNMEWVPWGERAFKETLNRVGKSKVTSTIKAGTFTSGFFDLLIFADKVDTKTNQLKRVFIFDEREPKNPLTVVARSGEIVSVKTNSDLSSAALLKLYNGSIHRNEAETSTYQKIDFGEYKLFLKVDEEASAAVIKPHMIPYKKLIERIRNSDPRSYDGREMRGEYWRRYAIALSPLIFVFLGIGFGTVRTRSVRAGAALIATVTLMVYWGIQTWATIQVLHGGMNPLLAMQLPNIVMLVVAIVGFRKATW